MQVLSVARHLCLSDWFVFSGGLPACAQSSNRSPARLRDPMLSKIAANDHLNLWNRKRSPSLMHVALSSRSSSDWVVSGVWLDPGPIGVQPASASNDEKRGCSFAAFLCMFWRPA
jgi:hypothetical protein